MSPQEVTEEKLKDRLINFLKEMGLHDMKPSALVEDILHRPIDELVAQSNDQLERCLIELGRYMIYITLRYNTFRVKVKLSVRQYEHTLMKRTSHMKNVKTLAERRALAESSDPIVKKRGDELAEDEAMRDLMEGIVDSVKEFNNNLKRSIDIRRNESNLITREMRTGLGYGE